jgi:hypothetical protein
VRLAGHAPIAARANESLSLAAKRHGIPLQRVVACFYSLAGAALDDDQIATARTKNINAKQSAAAWTTLAKRYITGVVKHP